MGKSGAEQLATSPGQLSSYPHVVVSLAADFSMIFGSIRDNYTFMDMRKRTLVTSQMPPMIDLELNQQIPLPELSLLGQGNFNQTSGHSMATALRNPTNPEVQHLPHQGNARLYGMSQYNDSWIQCAPHIRVPTSVNPCFPYLASSSGPEHFPSFRNYGSIGIPADAYARNSGIIEEVGYPYKKRFSEGVPVTFPCLNSSASSESFVAPFNSRHCYAGSHLTGGDYVVQHPQPAGDALWLDQHLNSSFDGRSAWTWNQAALSASHGDNVRGSPESMNLGVHRFHEIARISSTGFQHPPSTIIQHTSHQYPLPQLHMQGGRGQNNSFNPQVAAATPGIPLGSAYGIMNPQRNVPFTDHMAFNFRQGCVVPETMLQRPSIFQMRVLRDDEVTMLEAGAPDSDDQYRDMRLDIEHMSYEELLALEERIGNVRTGLSEETIKSQLKIKTSMPSAMDLNLEQPASENKETDSCTICLDVINDAEKIGILDCGHYYHADCLKQWLLMKNACPICKSEAFDLSKEDESTNR